VRGFFFNGLLENLQNLGDEALMRRCLEACGQEHFLDFFSYPAQLLSTILLTALPPLAERCGGGEEALRQLGRQATQDFLASVAGRAMLLTAHGRPKPLLDSLPSGFRVALSFGNAELVWTGATRGSVRMHPSHMPPPFHEGMVRQMLEATGARGISVSAQDTGELVVTCEFSWE
jgi:uncharacterized protein (TIGR02265 family)